MNHGVPECDGLGNFGLHCWVWFEELALKVCCFYIYQVGTKGLKLKSAGLDSGLFAIIVQRSLPKR